MDGMLSDFASVELFEAHLKLRDPNNKGARWQSYEEVSKTIIELRKAQSEIRRAEADLEIAKIQAEVELARIQSHTDRLESAERERRNNEVDQEEV